MKGYLTTCDGAQFELPTLLKWEFSYTGSVPCDSFTLRCAYEPAMAETLRRAVRFTAREDGTVEFAVEGGELAVFSSGEKREVKTAAPGGYEWQPKKGEDVLVVRGGTFGEEAYAVGAVGQSADDLAPGEVRIRSAAAGTEIVLRNNGRIDINGLLFINGMPYLGMGG